MQAESGEAGAAAGAWMLHALAGAVALACAGGILLAPLAVAARSGGIDSGQSDTIDGIVTTCSGSLCHGSASQDVFVTISGPDSLEFAESKTYTIEIFEMVEDALQAGAGLNVAVLIDGLLADASDAILSEESGRTRVTGIGFLETGQITHVSARSTLPDLTSLEIWSYDFTVTAPDEAATLTLQGAMNAFNNNLQNSGDNWSNTSLIISVPEPGSSVLGFAAIGCVAALRFRRPRPRG